MLLTAARLGISRAALYAGMALRQDPKRSAQDICDILHISQATFYRYVSANYELHAIDQASERHS